MPIFIDSEQYNELNIHTLLKNDNLTMNEVAQKLQKETVIEHLYFYKNGRQIARFEGENNYINPMETQMKRMKDCIVLHNHLEGTSFSVADVASIISYDAKELRVYSALFNYQVIRPQNGWGFTFSINQQGSIISDIDTLLLFEESRTTTDDMLHKMVMRGEIRSSEKQDLENHYIWTTFFKLKNISYVREKN